MKNKIALFWCLLFCSASVVLSQNYTNATAGTDVEALSLQKISYKLNHGINITNFAYNIVTNQLTRPADTAAYSVNDAVAATTSANNYPIQLANIVPNGTGKIVKVRILADSTAAAVMWRVWFYNGIDVAAATDNVAYAVSKNGFLQRLGYIDISTSAGSDCAFGMNIQDQLPVWSSSGHLFYRLQTLGAFTPSSEMKISLEVTVQPMK